MAKEFPLSGSLLPFNHARRVFRMFTPPDNEIRVEGMHHPNQHNISQENSSLAQLSLQQRKDYQG